MLNLRIVAEERQTILAASPTNATITAPGLDGPATTRAKLSAETVAGGLATNGEMTMILDAVLTDWFTNPDNRDWAYLYLQKFDDQGHKLGQTPLNRLLVDITSVPTNYVPMIRGIQTQLYTPELFKPGPDDLAVSFREIAIHSSTNATVTFDLRGFSNVGFGSCVTYEAAKKGTNWGAKCGPFAAF
jgi:hypothetical protein